MLFQVFVTVTATVTITVIVIITDSLESKGSILLQQNRHLTISAPRWHINKTPPPTELQIPATVTTLLKTSGDVGKTQGMLRKWTTPCGHNLIFKENVTFSDEI